MAIYEKTVGDWTMPQLYMQVRKRNRRVAPGQEKTMGKYRSKDARPMPTEGVNGVNAGLSMRASTDEEASIPVAALALPTVSHTTVNHSSDELKLNFDPVVEIGS